MKILYFAWVREKTGIASEEVNLPDTVKTVSQLIDWLVERGPEYASAFEKRDVIRTAVNQNHVKPDARITETDEVAFFPPVTGG